MKTFRQNNWKLAFLAFVAALGGVLFFAAMCVLYLAIMRFLVPETTGKSLEEIEAYWGE